MPQTLPPQICWRHGWQRQRQILSYQEKNPLELYKKYFVTIWYPSVALTGIPPPPQEWTEFSDEKKTKKWNCTSPTNITNSEVWTNLSTYANYKFHITKRDMKQFPETFLILKKKLKTSAAIHQDNED